MVDVFEQKIKVTQIQIKNQRKTTWEQKLLTQTRRRMHQWMGKNAEYLIILRGADATTHQNRIISRTNTESMHLLDDQRVVLICRFFTMSPQCIFEWTIECFLFRMKRTIEATWWRRHDRVREEDGEWTQKLKNGKWIIQLNSLQY